MENTNFQTNPALAAAITKAASQQTYYTIRFLVDRQRTAEAYQAYAYFRWVDDCLDSELGARDERIDFTHRQNSLLEGCYRGEPLQVASVEEQMLVDLIRGDQEEKSGLQSYLRNMMWVMTFDAERRGRLISQAELNEYTRRLACSVTEAMHYFVGHNCPAPCDETRYLAVSAAHVTHMLRDTFDDLQAGYYNIPREVLEAHGMQARDIDCQAYRAWVHSRVQLARTYFKAGRDYLARVKNLRCWLAGIAYTRRFEGVLDTIEREGYRLRPAYNEQKSASAGFRLVISTLLSMMASNRPGIRLQPAPARPHPLKEA